MIDGSKGTGTVTVAIMQPYLFPYLGYFQLARSVDQFWLLDTVSFIQRGWMNRNNLLIGGAKRLFTIPVASGPQDQLISDKSFGPNAVHAIDKLEKTLRNAYAKAPCLVRAIDLLDSLREAIVSAPQPADFTAVVEDTLRRTFHTIGIDTPIHRVSVLSVDPNIKGRDRILAVCQAIGASQYINMVNGRDLYDETAFREADIDLRFLKPVLAPYPQGPHGFVPGLSVLDAIARVPNSDFSRLLDCAEIIRA